MWKNKLTSSQEEKLDKYLFQMFWLNSKQIETIIRERKELDFLNNYRWALSLWAEYTQDTKQKIIVTLDWRDTAGKGSNIKRVTEYFDIKRHNEVAFWIPTAKERFEDNWFKRYQKYFPKPGEVTFFDRSWYNRAWVEAAMWFCTEEEYNWFMANVSEFEKTQIIDKKIDFIKVYLSITKETQKFRLKRREQDMKRWKSSFIDKQAQEKWNYYTLAKANILKMTDSEHAPWMVLDSNEKWLSATEIIKAIINTSEEVAKIISKNIDLTPNPKIVRTAEQELDRMKKSWDLKAMKTDFKFKNAA